MTGATANLWASMPIAALILDASNGVVDINPAAETFLNLSARSARAMPVWDLLHVDAPLDAGFDRARAQSTPLFVNDVNLGTGARAPVPCNLQIAPLLGQGAQPGQMLVLISPREMTGRVAQTRSARSAAKSAIGMAEMLAHEIKNPLAGITGAAQLLSMGLTAQDRELTDLIVGECRRIVALLDQVEDFGNQRLPDLTAINVHDVLDRARRSALLGFAAHMTIEERYDPSLPLALGDGDQLMQVVLNLVKNASEAAGTTAGTIHLRTYYDHALRVRGADGVERALPLQIEVEDNGPGLPEDIAGDVFDPFVSGRSNGTGLGLALAAKIISDHGGWINVTSVPGRVVFRMSLPLAPKNLLEDG